IDAAVESLCIEAQRIRNRHRDPLPILHGKQAAHLVARRDRSVFTKAEGVKLIDPGIVTRFGAAQILGAFDWRARHGVERPAFRTMLADCGRAGEWAFALASIEAGEVAAGERRPYDAVAGDVQTAR